MNGEPILGSIYKMKYIICNYYSDGQDHGLVHLNMK